MATSSDAFDRRLTAIEALLREVLALVGGDRLLNEREAAEMRGRSVHALRRERCEGRGPAYVKDPDTGSVRYRLADVRAWVARGNTRPNGKHEPNFSNAALAEDPRAVG